VGGEFWVDEGETGVEKGTAMVGPTEGGSNVGGQVSRYQGVQEGISF